MRQPVIWKTPTDDHVLELDLDEIVLELDFVCHYEQTKNDCDTDYSDGDVWKLCL